MWFSYFFPGWFGRITFNVFHLSAVYSNTKRVLIIIIKKRDSIGYSCYEIMFLKYIHGRTLYYCLASQVLFFSVLDVLLVDSGRSPRVNRQCPEPEYNGFEEMKKLKKKPPLGVHTGSCGPIWGWTFVPTAQHRPVVVRNTIIIITHRTCRVMLLEHPKGSITVFSGQ